jgi:hypothetical protein
LKLNVHANTSAKAKATDHHGLASLRYRRGLMASPNVCARREDVEPWDAADKKPVPCGGRKPV